jgi:hypothetical protein
MDINKILIGAAVVVILASIALMGLEIYLGGKMG